MSFMVTERKEGNVIFVKVADINFEIEEQMRMFDELNHRNPDSSVKDILKEIIPGDMFNLLFAPAMQ